MSEAKTRLELLRKAEKAVDKAALAFAATGIDLPLVGLVYPVLAEMRATLELIVTKQAEDIR